MKGRFMASFVALLFLGLFPAKGQAVEKLKFATATKVVPRYYLPPLAAQEKGIWKKNGLEAEWVPFASAPPLYQAVAGGAVAIGLTMAVAQFQAVAAGVPVVIVSNLDSTDKFFVWVRPQSRSKEPRDLKGAKIGVARMGSVQHIYGRVVAKALGLEDREVGFVASGGIPESLAALRTGSIDGVILSIGPMADLKVKGEAREFIAVEDYLPKEWLAHVGFAHRAFVKNSPDIIRKVIRSVLEATEFIRNNPLWATEKIKLTSGYSSEAAGLAYQELAYSQDGKVDPRAVENMRNFTIEYGLVAKEKIPLTAELFTAEFTQ